MSIAVETSVTDNATAKVQSAIAGLSPQQLNSAVGPACQRHVQRHLRANGTNKRGWPTTNFWSRAAKATSWAGTGEGPVISINQIGARQRFYGGHIGPVRKGALAIPISPLSYGKVPADFPGLFKMQTKKGAYLVRWEGTFHGEAHVMQKGKRARRASSKPAKNMVLEFLFKLSGGVDQEADPSVLPTMAELGETATGAILEKFERIKGQRLGNLGRALGNI